MVPMKLLMLFMHVRSDAASVTGTTCFRNILEHTKPGGLLEIQEPEAWMRSEVDTMSNETVCSQFNVLCNEAAKKSMKKMNMAG
ncbi:hypothetical protein ACO22_05548 [Paracoccidioides brasiliensis]|uniref:O-methyltransferase domain-containing protein n=1 Tax=Paracoccidioides brasiliensis TaxID=121759 RepID=A0A1D2JA44_PARBR|nr:hypothetical protein ACO22_05548 [Paracoccidioides brasiliensis]